MEKIHSKAPLYSPIDERNEKKYAYLVCRCPVPMTYAHEVKIPKNFAGYLQVICDSCSTEMGTIVGRRITMEDIRL